MVGGAAGYGPSLVNVTKAVFGAEAADCATDGLCPALQVGEQLSQKVSGSLWPAHWDGRQIINGINYSIHALERMAPVGLGGRGIPPSAVENAINFGNEIVGGEPNIVLKIYENVTVVWNFVDKVVVTVIKTGH